MSWLQAAWAQAQTQAEALAETLAQKQAPTHAGSAARNAAELLASIRARRAAPALDSRDEAWRYFPLRPLLMRKAASAPLAEANFAPQDLAGELRLVIADGRVLPQYSNLAPGPLELSSEPVMPWFELKQYQAPKHAFTALNFCLAEQPVAVRVPGRIQVDPVLHIHWLLGAGESHARVRLLVDEGASLKVIEHHHALEHHALAGSDGSAIGTTLLDAQLGKNSSLQVLRRIHDLPASVRLSRSEFHLHERARLEWTGLERSVGTARHELQVCYHGPGASAKLQNAALLSGRGYSETRLEHRHEIAETQSRTLWKILADGRSRGVFNGRIFIAQGADQTDAGLRTASMLLSEQAEVDTKPELEIYAEEVKAAHGATIGQLDAHALFYLRSRGLSEAMARDLLLRAFVLEIGSEITDSEMQSVLSADFAALFPESVEPSA